MTVPASEARRLSPDDADAGSRGRRELAGPALALASSLPAVALAGWTAAALPLLLAGWFRVVPATVLGVVVVVVLARPALAAATACARTWGRVPWWVLASVLAIAVGFGVLSYLTSADDVIIRRDPGSYSVISTWLAQHGQLQVPTHAAAFGGNDPGISFATQGYYPGGDAVVPQFMSGVPATFAIGGWIAGLSGVLHMNAVLGPLALLAFGGLVARLLAPAWAPLGTLALAATMPQMHVARAAFSEPAAQLLMLGGICLLVDALHHLESARWRPSVVVAGLVLGLVTLVRIDALADLVPIVPYLAFLAYRRSPVWRPLAAALAVGVGFGLLDGVTLSYRYFVHLGGDLLLAVGGCALAIAVSWLGLRAARAGRLRRPTWPRWPQLAGGLVVLAGAAFAVRPWVMTARADPHSGGAQYVARIQENAGIAVDPTRSYYENSLHWVAWYVGWAAIGLAVIGAAWLVWRQATGAESTRPHRPWPPVLLLLLGATALVLWRPSITPDHPWADRRLVQAVLPTMVLFALVAIAAGRRWVIERWARSGLFGVGGIAVAGAAAVLVPAMLASAPLLSARTETGESAMVGQVCDQLHPGDVVLTVGPRARAEWTASLRVLCGVPTASLVDVAHTSEVVDRVAAGAQAAGHQLVLLASDVEGVASVTVDWGRPVARLSTTEDAHTLVRRPDSTAPLEFTVWLYRVPVTMSSS